MAKRFDLAKRAKELIATYNGPCTGKRMCAFLQAVVDGFDGKRPGLSVEPFLDLRTGKWKANRAVMFVPGGQFAELSFCPFCGVNFRASAKSKVTPSQCDETCAGHELGDCSHDRAEA